MMHWEIHQHRWITANVNDTVIPNLRHDYTDRDEVMGFQGALQDVLPE